MTKIPGTNLQMLDLPADPPADNDPCWCTSGEPFAACHKDRKAQIPESKWTILRQVRKLHGTAYCSHPLASPQECKGKIVRAHTLQKSGSLSTISVNRHVYGLEEGGMPDDNGYPPFKLIGVNEASTFTGFCQRHDTELFQPLEMKPFTTSKEQFFLLAYRALSKEVYAKRFALRIEPILRRGDVGKEPFQQVILQNQLYVMAQLHRLSLRDLEANLKDYEQIYLAQDFDRMSAYVVFADRTLDFVVSGGVYPEFDFAGLSLQDLATPNRLEFLTYSALAFQTGGVIAFVWDSTRGGSCVQLMRSLDSLASEDVPDALVRLTFEHFENTYADPRWWEGMSDSERGRLLLRLATAASPENRKANCLADDGLRTARWKVIVREWL
jgi:hypothetical protein